MLEADVAEGWDAKAPPCPFHSTTYKQEWKFQTIKQWAGHVPIKHKIWLQTIVKEN